MSLRIFCGLEEDIRPFRPMRSNGIVPENIKVAAFSRDIIKEKYIELLKARKRERATNMMNSSSHTGWSYDAKERNLSF